MGEDAEELDRQLDHQIDTALSGYSRVEIHVGVVERLLERRAEPLPRRRWLMPAPAWALIAVTAVLLLALAMVWYRGHQAKPIPQPHLAGEHMSVFIPKTATPQPLTDEQKVLIQLLAKDPKALSNLTPEQLDKLLQAQKDKHP